MVEITDRVRCNNCMDIFDENITKCPNCGTAKRLMQPFVPANEDWKQHLKDYREFMQWDDDVTTDYDKLTQEEAKKALQDDLEFIIGTNGGYGGLFETERMYMKLLNMEVEDD